MKTIIFDDDPTGTQCSRGIRVIMEFSPERLEAALLEADAVFVQTNSRAIDVTAAVDRISTYAYEAENLADKHGWDVRFVLRGDSTLRGHVFAEINVLARPESVIVFVPAFPGGGRVTVDGVHYVTLGDEVIPAHLTEYALDPVFPFSTSVLTEYVAKYGQKKAISTPLEEIRAGGFAEVLAHAAPGVVLVPDAETDDDLRLIARAIDAAMKAGQDVVVRCAAPLAAMLAGVYTPTVLSAATARKLLAETVDGDEPPTALLVCGSHTEGATAQLKAFEKVYGEPTLLSTLSALTDPARAGDLLWRDLLFGKPYQKNFAVRAIASGRKRASAHNSLAHGERVMTALCTAVRKLRDRFAIVVAKGGITSSEVARVGLEAPTAWVLGPLLPGVPMWRLDRADGRHTDYVVVPGNVGGPETLVEIFHKLGMAQPEG